MKANKQLLLYNYHFLLVLTFAELKIIFFDQTFANVIIF